MAKKSIVEVYCEKCGAETEHSEHALYDEHGNLKEVERTCLVCNKSYIVEEDYDN